MWVPGEVDTIDKQYGSIKPIYPEVSEPNSEDSDDSGGGRRRNAPKRSRLKGPVETMVYNILERDDGITKEIENLILIDDINEGNVIELLQLRHENLDFFTNCAGVLVAINPYMRYNDIFGIEGMVPYLNKLDNPFFEMNNAKPHLYSLIVKGLHPIVHDGKSQACTFVYLGDSGAGKTESFIYSLDFICTYFSKDNTNGRSRVERNVQIDGMGQEMIGSVRFLNYITRVKTPINNSASRSSLLLKVYLKEGKMVGFKYKYYYLEKNRLVSHNDGETLFHIFRLMHEGMPSEMKTKYELLNDLSAYNLIKKSLKTETTMNYSAHWKLFKDALDVIYVITVENQYEKRDYRPILEDFEYHAERIKSHHYERR